MIFQRSRERFATLIAFALPAHLAYWVAIRVLTHASVTRYADVPLSSIGGMEAITYWHDFHFPRKKAASSFTEMQTLAAPLREWRGGESLRLPEIDPEDPEQATLVETVLRRGASV